MAHGKPKKRKVRVAHVGPGAVYASVNAMPFWNRVLFAVVTICGAILAVFGRMRE